jgi:predicted GNAT family N-acyltransferase
MAIKIQEPKTLEEFSKYYDLRWRVLRKPWDQPRGSEKDDLEEKSIHLMALDVETLVGVGRAHFNSPQEAQIRYMAVEESWRGKGVGRMLLLELERRVTAGGAKTVVLNAREEVIPFYQRHQYQTIADGPTLFGSIRHVRMEKKLK